MFNNWHKILENLTTGFCELVQADDRHHWSCQPQRPKVIRSTLHYVVNYLLLNKLFYLYARSQNMLYIIMNRILCHYKYITCLCTYNKPRKVFLAKNLRALSSLYNNWDSGHGIKLLVKILNFPHTSWELLDKLYNFSRFQLPDLKCDNNNGASILWLLRKLNETMYIKCLHMVSPQEMW